MLCGKVSGDMATNRRKHPPNPKIATRIRAALDWHGMTQADCAAMVDVEPSAVSQILSGAVRPRDDTVRRIADGLGEDFDFLMGYEDTGTTGVGGAVEAILKKATPDELALLGDLSAGDFHRAMGAAAIKHTGRKRRRKSGRAILGVVLAVVAAGGILETLFHCPPGCVCLLGAVLNYFPHLHI